MEKLFKLKLLTDDAEQWLLAYIGLFHVIPAWLLFVVLYVTGCEIVDWSSIPFLSLFITSLSTLGTSRNLTASFCCENSLFSVSIFYVFSSLLVFAFCCWSPVFSIFVTPLRCHDVTMFVTIATFEPSEKKENSIIVLHSTCQLGQIRYGHVSGFAGRSVCHPIRLSSSPLRQHQPPHPVVANRSIVGNRARSGIVCYQSDSSMPSLGTFRRLRKLIFIFGNTAIVNCC